jgi:hypothetical protein
MDVFWNDPIRKITNIMDSDLAMQAEKTNFVKLFPWPFRVLPPEAPAKASSSTPPQIFIQVLPNENMKIRLWFSFQRCGLVLCFATQKGECVIVE